LKRHDLPAAVVTVIGGVLLATLPHIVWAFATGRPAWLADNDDLGLYLAVGSQALYNHPAYLSDPMLATGGMSVYPGIQLIPGVLVTKSLNLGPEALGVVWRTIAGVTVALGWYLLIRRHSKTPWVAAALSLILLADVGTLFCRPLLRPALVTIQLLTGHTEGLLDHSPQLHVQWRIISPGLSLGFLLLYMWLLERAREQPTRQRLAWSGLGFSLLFPAYFYYLTAAGLGLILGFVLDRDHRRAYWHTAWIGTVIGIPFLLSKLLFKGAGTSYEWLQRSDKFLPIARFSELLLPMGAFAVLGLSFVWVWLRRKDLLHIWCLAAAALLLLNHQLLTGLQIENFHWVYVWGPMLSSLILLLVLKPALARTAWSTGAVVFGALAVTLHLALGLWLRFVEATQTKESVELMASYRQYLAQRPRGVPMLAANSVVAGDPRFVNLAVVLENQRPLDHYSAVVSSAIDNDEWDERIALNDYLQGIDRLSFERHQKTILEKNHWGPWARDPIERAKRLENRLAHYDRIAETPGLALGRFSVRYVALPAGERPRFYSGPAWRTVQQGRSWTIWERP
jgi:hypothetical protein